MASAPRSSTPRARLTMRQSIALVWRTLRSMRTALILLLLLALASVGGSLLPQIPNSPQRVARYLGDHPFWGQVFLRTGMFDAFGSWWFTLITVLLFTSLVACIVPRSRALVRSMRQRPLHAREIDGFASYAERRVPVEPGAAIAAARSTLRRRWFRVSVAPDAAAIAADKGILREVGSLVFHWAFVVLLVGVVVGKGTGYSGRATIVEGRSWTDAEVNYDGTLRAGRFFSDGFSGAGIRLLSFENAFRDSGIPMDFVSDVELLDPEGTLVRTEEIRVNDPARFDGLWIYQFGFGWAPELTVTAGGRPVFDAPVVMGQESAPEGVSQLAMPWRGFVKLPSLEPQMAVELELWPDGRSFFEAGRPMIEVFSPLIRYQVWEGRLADPSQRSLDTRLMQEVANGVMAGEWTVDLVRGCVVSGPSGEFGDQLQTACPAGGPAPQVTMRFDDLPRYSVLLVSKDVGVPIVLLAAILILLGLMPALYTTRRKLWVRADADGEGTTLKVGGFALQGNARFEEEFAKVVDAMAHAAGGPRAPERDKVGSP